ncbi:MAG: class I SAM-dependent methyltransferase [Phycisphaerales bacterium]|nr:MAG: class I SAM-dependent methyltransferase [Phycisphaerales bacterium]
MHTKLDTDNPYGCDRYGFAWQQIPAGGTTHLDFGCGNGRFLKSLKHKGIKCLVGVDVSQEAVKQAYHASGGLEVIHLTQTTPLPFPDKLFSSITLMDVLEHVAEQGALLNELCRVLQDDGTLIVTVPGHHFFSFLDIGNFKFRFPRLHRWFYCRKHPIEKYEKRYAANPDGLIGDVSAAKHWHEHFSPDRLAALLEENGLDAVSFDGTGYFTRVLKIADLLAGRFGPLRAAIKKSITWDAHQFHTANVFCVARKSAASCQKHEEHVQDDHDSTGHNIETADPQHVLQRCGVDE